MRKDFLPHRRGGTPHHGMTRTEYAHGDVIIMKPLPSGPMIRRGNELRARAGITSKVIAGRAAGW
jgi:hypothetical protein